MTDRNINQSSDQSESFGSQMSGDGKNQDYSGKFEDSRMDPNHEDYDPNWKPGPVGSVEDPENDGRLEENRESGRTKGTTAHSAQAPHVDRDDSGSINAPGNQGSQTGGNQGGGSNR